MGPPRRIGGHNSVLVAFHWFAFLPMGLGDVLYLSAFRAAALIPLIKYKSVLPAMMGHTSVNASALAVSLLA